ncbi:MAG: hypothetical protein WBG73_18160 [Coleofasciculaceae cyanobacterium]
MTGLQCLAPQIQYQNQDFEDLPDIACPKLVEVVQAMQQLVSQRWQELQKFAV